MEGQRSHTVQNLVVLTLTFHFQHGFVAFVQDTADRTAVRFHDPLHCKHVFFVQIGTVHLPAAIHEVMCLIHQEQIVSLYPLLKKSVSDIHSDQIRNCNHRQYCPPRLPHPDSSQTGTPDILSPALKLPLW